MRSSRGSVLLRVVLVLGGLGLLLLAFVARSFPRAGAARIEAAQGVVGVDTGGSYAWLLRTAQGVVLIDAGLDVGGDAIRAELDRQDLGPDAVHTVLLTHGHPDHWAGAHLFPNAKVYAGPGEAAYLRGEREYQAPGAALAGRVLDRGPLPTKLEELADGQELALDGETVRVVHTPGHTPGSVCFLWRDLLFTGDSLLTSGPGEVRLSPSVLSEDAAQNRASLEKLRELPFTRIADGHTGATLDARQKLQALLR